MIAIDSKTFVFSRPPTGADVCEIIKDNELHAWNMKIEKRFVNASVMNYSQNVYDVIFSKEVK